MNDENIKWMNVKITESNRYVSVEFVNDKVISAKQIKSLHKFANKNNLSLLNVYIYEDFLYYLYKKQKNSKYWE